MAIWVCRTGPSGQFSTLFFENQAIYLTRDGLAFDLKEAEKVAVLNSLSELLPGAAKQTISNTWSQIDIFANRMRIGDTVIVPKKNSMLISVGVITGSYHYEEDEKYPLQHSRKVKYIAHDINTNNFPQDIKYSLGAFRTIFSVKQEERLLNELTKEGVVFP